MTRSFISCLSMAAILIAGLAVNSPANTNIIYGTGVGKNPIAEGTFQRDDHWTIVAVASDFDVPGGQTAPYAAYVPYFISPVFFGGQSPVWGGNNGYTVHGETYYWISPNTTSAYAPFPATWSFIAAQQFTITTAGTYEFDFWGNGDNSMAFYIGGTVSNVGTNNPTIVGGTQIGTTQGGDLNRLYQYTGSTYLSAGVHTAYAVVVDTGFDAGAFITNSTFGIIPEPSSLFLLAGGAGWLALSTASRRRRALRISVH